MSLVLALVFSSAVAAPFVSSSSQPHAVLYLDYQLTAQNIWPVRIWMVDGKLTNHSNQGVIWIKPGTYTFIFKLTKIVNRAFLPGLIKPTSQGQQMHQLKLRLKAGKTYYISAQFNDSGDWLPKVWKTEESSF